MRLLAVGDNVVDRYLYQGRVYPGGGAVNIAVHSRRCGAQAHYMGVLGNDENGQLIIDSLRKEGVDTTLCRVVVGSNSVTDIVIGPSGERSFVGYSPLDARVELTDSARTLLSEVDWVYTNYSSATEDLVDELGALAPLAFDFSNRDFAYAQGLLPAVRVAAFSRPAMSEHDARELAITVRSSGPTGVVITRGADNAILLFGEEWMIQPAHRIRALDTLGAGDAFLARLLCGLADGELLATTTDAASSYAADTCLHFGAFGYPVAYETKQ